MGRVSAWGRAPVWNRAKEWVMDKARNRALEWFGAKPWVRTKALVLVAVRVMDYSVLRPIPRLNHNQRLNPSPA